MRTKTSVIIGLSVVRINYTTSGYFAVLRKRESSKLYLPEAPISNFFLSHRRLLCNCMCYLTKLGIWIAISSLTQVKFFPQADHTS